METSPVIHLVTDAKGTVIHEVHVQMQELPLGMKALAPEVGAALPSGHSVPGRVQTLASAGPGQTCTYPVGAHLFSRWHCTGQGRGRGE